MNAIRVDVIADVLVETDRRLREWGDSCRSSAERLGLPASSGIARMIEVVKVFEQRRRGVRLRKKALARGVVEKTAGEIDVCPGCGLVFVGEECSRCAGKLTARGTQTKSFKPMTSIQLSGSVMVTDAVVAALPGWAQKIIIRAYLWSQPDRMAAQDLRMPRNLYRMQREAAVELVAERFASRK